MEQKKKIIFFYLKTGGGHLAMAKNLSSALSQQYPNQVEPILIDAFADAPKYAKKTVVEGYEKSQIYTGLAYWLLFALNYLKPIRWFTEWLIKITIKPDLKRIILTDQPDVIVSVHFLLNKALEETMAELKINKPLVVVVCDPFTPHPLWFYSQTANYVVFSERAKSVGLDYKISNNQINQFDFFPVASKFHPNGQHDTTPLKTSLGFDPTKPIVLISGGGDGGSINQLLINNLLKELPNTQIAVICATNERLKQLLLKINNPLLKVYGFIDNFDELLTVADLVIAKAGPAVVAEILLSKKIPLINAYIWRQELGNVEFITKNGLGYYEPKQTKLIALAKKLLIDANLRATIQKNISQIPINNSSNQVADYLYNLTK